MSQLPASATSTEHAIAWAVRLASGNATDADVAACRAWRDASPEHDNAWMQIQALEDLFHSIPKERAVLATQTLQAAGPLQHPERRRALKRLGAGVIGLTAIGLTLRAGPWWSTQRITTTIGARRRIELADGTVLHANTASDVEFRLSPLRRVIVLHAGEVHIDTGKDSLSLMGPRSFWVHTRQAQLEALGTQFGVVQRDLSVMLYVDDGKVAVHYPHQVKDTRTPARVIARHGERYVIRDGDGAPVRVDDPSWNPAAWTDGVLLARQMRLDAFIAELARYSPHPLSCDSDVAGLRVSGVFQLDGDAVIDRALDALMRSLPLRKVRGPGDETRIARAP